MELNRTNAPEAGRRSSSETNPEIAAASPRQMFAKPSSRTLTSASAFAR